MWRARLPPSQCSVTWQEGEGGGGNGAPGTVVGAASWRGSLARQQRNKTPRSQIPRNGLPVPTAATTHQHGAVVAQAGAQEGHDVGVAAGLQDRHLPPELCQRHVPRLRARLQQAGKGYAGRVGRDEGQLAAGKHSTAIPQTAPAPLQRTATPAGSRACRQHFDSHQLPRNHHPGLPSTACLASGAP